MAIINTLNSQLLKRNRITTQINEKGSEVLPPLPSEEVYRKPPLPLRSPKKVIDLNGFYSLMKEVVDFKLEKDGWNKKLIFTEDFPDVDDDISTEIITIGCQRRVPGILEQTPNPMPRNPIRARKPRLREMAEDPDHPRYQVEVMGRIFDNFVEITCWARENKIANIRALWLEDMMLEYEWIFQASGIHFLRYEGRGADLERIEHNRKVVGRPMVYLVRTEKVTARYSKKLEEAAIKLNLLPK